MELVNSVFEILTSANFTFLQRDNFERIQVLSNFIKMWC